LRIEQFGFGSVSFTPWLQPGSQCGFSDGEPFQTVFPAYYVRKPLKRLYKSEAMLITGLKPRCE